MVGQGPVLSSKPTTNDNHRWNQSQHCHMCEEEETRMCCELAKLSLPLYPSSAAPVSQPYAP